MNKVPVKTFLAANENSFQQNFCHFVKLLINQNKILPREIVCVYENNDFKTKAESSLKNSDIFIEFSEISDFMASQNNKTKPAVIFILVSAEQKELSENQKIVAEMAEKLTVYTSTDPLHCSLKNLPYSSQISLDGKIIF